MSELEHAQRAQELAEKRAVEARQDARQLGEQNRRLQETLRLAKDRLTEARRQLEQLTQPPLSYATALAAPRLDDGTIDVDLGGRLLRVAYDPTVQASGLVPGSRLLLNESMMVVGIADRRTTGDMAVVKEVLPGGDRAIID
ncbi:MAG: hypothetical protein ACRCWS_03910, partial [Propionibacteriaceae bacterium]